MINKLSFYIIKKFAVNLVAAVAAWIVIFVVVNMIERISTFIDYGASLEQILLYYLYYIPNIISLTLPIAVLLATLFAVSNLAQHNEIVAQLSSGISLYRILMPVFAGGIILSIAAGFFNELVVPEANAKRIDLYRFDIRDNPRTGSIRNNIYVQDREDRKLTMKYYNSKTAEGRDASLQMFDGPRLVERIDARRMVWRDSVWVMIDARLRSFGNGIEKVEMRKDTTISDSRIRPRNLVSEQKDPEEMSYTELNEFIAEQRAIGADPKKWLVEKHLKIAMPFANFIVVLIGAPFASRKRRGGTGLNFGISLLISFAFFILIRFGQVMGHQGTLEPVMAAWLGNLVFLTLGLYTLFSVQK